MHPHETVSYRIIAYQFQAPEAECLPKIHCSPRFVPKDWQLKAEKGT
jgi:hypothetical protein